MADEGLMRTHLIMNSRRLTTFQDSKSEVTNVEQAQSAVIAKTGDAMDADAFSKGSSKGASLGAGRSKDSEVLCWYCESASDCRKKQEEHDRGQPKGSKKGDSKGKCNKKRRNADPKKRLHSKLATSWQRRDASKW